MEKRTYDRDESSSSEDGEQGPTATARRFGMRSESAPLPHDHQQSAIHPNVTKNQDSESKERETTAWEVYNKRAAIVDRELIKDWNDGLNTLLIFAALYSAVLTAFIVESMQLLKEDPTETTRDILVQLSKQMANNSLPAYDYDPDSFRAPTWAIRVNYYFFISISCSLVAALGAVLALQWVGNYDTGLNTSSPKDRALQRHYRSIGTEEYKLHQVIAFLPLLIFIALLLFFIGMSDWLWHINQGVGAVVIFGLAAGAMFYMITTGISMVRVAAPFRTPVSKSLPILLWQMFRPLGSVARLFTRKGLIRAARGSKRLLSTYRLSQDVLIDLWFGSVKTIKSLNGIKNFAQKQPFTERERSMVLGDTTLERRSLLWIARSIDILPHQHTNFVVILKAFTDLPVPQLLALSLQSPASGQHLYLPSHSKSPVPAKSTNMELQTQLDEAPWLEIFSLLTRNFVQKSRRRDYSEDELKQATFLARSLAVIGNGVCTRREPMITDPQIRSFILSLFLDSESDDIKSKDLEFGELGSYTNSSLDLTEQYAKQALWRQWARHKRQDWHEIVVVHGRKVVGWKWAINIGIRALCPFIAPSVQRRSPSQVITRSQPRLELRSYAEPEPLESPHQLLIHGPISSDYILFQMLSYQAEQKARPSLLEDQTIEVFGRLCDISEDQFGQVLKSDLLPGNIFIIILTMLTTHLLQLYPHPEYHEDPKDPEEKLKYYVMTYLHALETTISNPVHPPPTQSLLLHPTPNSTIPSRPAPSMMTRDQIHTWGRVHVSVLRQVLARTAIATRDRGTSDTILQTHLDTLVRLVNSPLSSHSNNPHSKAFSVPREMLLVMGLNPTGYWAVPNSPQSAQVFSKSIFPSSSSAFNFDLATALANGDKMLEKNNVTSWAAWFSEVLSKMDDILDERSERDQMVLIAQLKQISIMVKSKTNVQKETQAEERARTRVRTGTGTERNGDGGVSNAVEEGIRVPPSFSRVIPVTILGEKEGTNEKEAEADVNYEISYKIERLQRIRSLPLSLIAAVPVAYIWHFPSFKLFDGHQDLEDFETVNSYEKPSDSASITFNEKYRGQHRRRTLPTMHNINSPTDIRSLLHDPLFEDVFTWWSGTASDNLHSSVIPFIRSVILYGPSQVRTRVNFLFPYWEYVEGKRFNSQQAHEIFRAPALSILLAHAVLKKPNSNPYDAESTPGSLLVQINTFNRFEWFTREFTAASGFKWLEERIFPNLSSNTSQPGYMNQPVSPQFGTGSWAASICFDIIRYSIIPIIRHEDLLAWVRYTRRLLVLCGKLREHVNDEVGAGSEAKPGAKSRVVITERAEKISKLGPSKSSLEETATTFKEILRQQEERRNGLEPTPQKFEAGLFYWRLVELPPTEKRFEYVSSWSDEEWDSWTRLMREIIGGLLHGHIREH